MGVFLEEVTENSYSRQEELTFWDCDEHKRMRMAAILSKLAIYAGYDYDARGLTHEKLWALREVFLLSRIGARIHRLPVAGDVLTVTTWEDGVKGAHVRRVYEARDRAGALCLSAKSEWILVDPVSRRILRPSAFTARAIPTCGREIDAPEPKKLRLPREGRERLGVHRVAWSELDGNGHLFSGNYGDIIWNALPREDRERTPREFFINYSREGTLDEELVIEAVREGNTLRVAGTGPEGSCFESEILF